MFRIFLLFLMLPTLASADRASAIATMEQLAIDRQSCKQLIMFHPSIPFPYDEGVKDIVQKRLEGGDQSQTDNDPFFTKKNLMRSAIYLEKNFKLENAKLAKEFLKYEPLTDEELNRLAEQSAQNSIASMQKIQKIYENEYNASNFNVSILRNELKGCAEKFLSPFQLEDPYLSSLELPPLNLAKLSELNAHKLRLTEQFYGCYTLTLFHPDFEFPFDPFSKHVFETILVIGHEDDPIDVFDEYFEIENMEQLATEMVDNFELRNAEIDVALIKFPPMTVEEEIMFETEYTLLEATAHAKVQKLLTFKNLLDFDYKSVRAEIKECVEKFR